MGDDTAVKQWLSEMRNEALQPNEVTFNATWRQFSKRFWINRGCDQGPQQAQPVAGPLISLLASLCEAEEWLEKMEELHLQPSVLTYNRCGAPGASRSDCQVAGGMCRARIGPREDVAPGDELKSSEK